MSHARKENLIVGAFPVDLSAAALSGAWVSMSGVELATLALIASAGTAGDDPVITLEQAEDSSGAGAKPLMLKRLDYRIGSGEYTEVSTISEDNPATSYDSEAIDGAESQLVLRVTVRPMDLDINTGYSHVRLKCADVGSNAQLGCIVATVSVIGSR